MDPVEFLVHKLDLSLNILRDLCNVGVYSWPNPWLRKSSRSLSRNIDKLAVTVPGRFLLFPKFPIFWLVTDTCSWNANKYPVKQEIINCLKSRRIIPRPREHSQHITITTLPQISRKKTWSLCVGHQPPSVPPLLPRDLGAEPIDPDAKSSNLINDFRTSDFIEPSELNQSSSSSLTPPKRGAGT